MDTVVKKWTLAQPPWTRLYRNYCTGENLTVQYCHHLRLETFSQPTFVINRIKNTVFRLRTLAEDSGCTSGFSRFATLFSSAPSPGSIAIDVDALMTDPITPTPQWWWWPLCIF